MTRSPLRASPTPGPVWTPEEHKQMNREAIARIIDPEAWDEISADDNEEVAAIFAEAWEDALSKADAILGLEETVRPSSAQRGRGGDEAEPDHPDLDPINRRLA